MVDDRRPSGSATCAPLPRDPTKGLAALDLLIQKNVMADAGQAAARGDHHRSRRLRRAERRPARPRRADPPGHAAQLGVEPVRQAPQHGVRADRPAAVERRRAARRATRTSRRSRCRCPTRAERTAFLEAQVKATGKDVATFSDYSVAELGKLTAGIGAHRSRGARALGDRGQPPARSRATSRSSRSG